MPRDPAPKVVHLPREGVALFATDLHGNLRDYQRLEALYADEEARGQRPVLVLCGDLVHGPNPAMNAPGEWPDYLGTPYVDRSAELLFRYIAFALRARTVCLMGNHEHAHVGGPTLGKFYPDEAAALERGMEPAAVGAAHAFLRRLPLLAVTRCGAVFTHAAPARHEPDLDAFEELSWGGYEDLDINRMHAFDTVGGLLWSRYAEPAAARAFLEATSSDGLPKCFVAFGHDVIREGYEKVGREQICVSTSYGLHDERKTYLRLDLSARYESVDDLREGHEIRRLY